jgi:hypothetical protein
VQEKRAEYRKTMGIHRNGEGENERNSPLTAPKQSRRLMVHGVWRGPAQGRYASCGCESLTTIPPSVERAVFRLVPLERTTSQTRMKERRKTHLIAAELSIVLSLCHIAITSRIHQVGLLLVSLVERPSKVNPLCSGKITPRQKIIYRDSAEARGQDTEREP